MTNERFLFGSFELSTSRRELRRDGRIIDLSARAFDLLVALLKRPGRVISKAELLFEVWPGVTVEPNNLEVYVSVIRKIFETGQWSSGPIVTIRGRGYCFVEPVRIQRDLDDEPDEPEEVDGGSGPMAHRFGLVRPLERSLAPIIGRDEDVVLVRARLLADRFVTLVGPGGAGKTRLAQEVGRRLAGEIAGGACLADFAGATTLREVLEILSEQLQIASSGCPLDVAAYAKIIGDTPLLIIFDTCEHISEIIALLANALMGHCASLLILSTSRRRLGVSGEVMFDVLPLATSPVPAMVTASNATRIAAVTLFVDRAGAVTRHFKLDDANAADIALLCSRLDGLPLAIELAVPLLKVLTPKALLQCVERRPHAMINPNRAAPARHRTLHDLVAWSVVGLTERERTLFCHVSIFTGPIALRAVQEVVFGDGADQDDVLMMLFDLVEKSLVSADPGESEMRFAMSNVVRDYGRAQLARMDTRDLYERLTTHLIMRLDEAGRAWERVLAEVWRADTEDIRRNIEAALTWAFGSQGDTRIGIELVGAAHPIWHDMGDPRRWIATAMAAMDTETDPALRARLMSWPEGLNAEADLKALEEAARFYRGTGAAFEEAACLSRAGGILCRFDVAAGERLLVAAEATLVHFGRTKTLVRCLRSLSEARAATGDEVRAREFERQSHGILHSISEVDPGIGLSVMEETMLSSARV